MGNLTSVCDQSNARVIADMICRGHSYESAAAELGMDIDAFPALLEQVGLSALRDRSRRLLDLPLWSACELLRIGVVRKDVARQCGVSLPIFTERLEEYVAATGEEVPDRIHEHTVPAPGAAFSRKWREERRGEGDAKAHAGGSHPWRCGCRSCVRGREIDAEVLLRRRIGWETPTLTEVALSRRSVVSL